MKRRLLDKGVFFNLPFLVHCLSVDQLFPWEQVQPGREFLVTVVKDAGADDDSP